MRSLIKMCLFSWLLPFVFVFLFHSSATYIITFLLGSHHGWLRFSKSYWVNFSLWQNVHVACVIVIGKMYIRALSVMKICDPHIWRHKDRRSLDIYYDLNTPPHHKFYFVCECARCLILVIFVLIFSPIYIPFGIFSFAHRV